MTFKTVREQRREAKLQKDVDDFNRSFPVGAPVILQSDDGPVETTVRGPAQIMCGSVVAWFSGVSGSYCVENRVTPAQVGGQAHTLAVSR